MVSQKRVIDHHTPRPKRLPRIIKHQDFLFITPAGTARMLANIIIIRGERNSITFIDCGSAIDPGNALLGRIFKKYSIPNVPDISLLITHNHTDHVGNYWWFRQQMPQLQAYASAAEANYIIHPLSSTPYWDRINMMVGGTGATNLLRRVAMTIALPRVFGRIHFYNPIDFAFAEKVTRLRVGCRIIEPILTPGHSPGHCAYLDESKYLFLGDLVPGTPWLDPAPSAIAQIIESVQKILRVPDKKVDFAVRSHCNASDHGRFVYPWGEERARFENFLDLITGTLERIPALLRGRIISTWDVAKAIIKNFTRYSTFMNRLWVPPGISWIVGYLGYLEQQGKIRQVSGYNQAAWSS